MREAVEGDRFPLSPRVRRLKRLRDKLAPPAPTPFPPVKPPGAPSLALRRNRRWR